MSTKSIKIPSTSIFLTKLRDAYQECNGVISKIAVQMSCSRSTVCKYLKKYPQLFPEVNNPVVQDNRITAKDIKVALDESEGSFAKAADMIGCNIKDIEDLAVSNPLVQETVEEWQERKIEQVEEALFYEATVDHDFRATQYYLKCFASDRGYVDADKAKDNRETKVAHKMAEAELRLTRMKKAEAIDVTDESKSI